jgi:hypothetical protein
MTMRIIQLLAVICLACGAATTGVDDTAAATTASAAPPTPAPTKPPFSQPPLDPPTHVWWAIDPSQQPDRRLFELHFDGAAMGFRLLDTSGRIVITLPIAGSGIFGPETCIAELTSKAQRRAATWVGIDDPTYQLVVANWPSYRVEVDTIGHGTITLPLEYSGCRRL